MRFWSGSAGALLVSASAFVLGCGASAIKEPQAAVAVEAPIAATTATPSSKPAAAAEAPRESAPLAWMTVPYPARSIARLRTLLQNAPRPLQMLDAAFVRFQAFDHEQPAFLMSNGESHIASFGAGKDLADTLRKSNNDEKCSVLELRGNLRFVCGIESKPGDDLMRAEPPRATTSDLHAEANAAVLRYPSFLREFTKKNDDKPIEVLVGIDRLSLDIVLEGTPELRVAWHMTGEDSNFGWLNAPVAPPPAGFLQLPADSEMAIFGHAPSAADQAPMKRLLLDAIGDKDAECAANTAAERADIAKLFFTGGSFVGAMGLDRPKAEAAAEALSRAPTDKKKLAAARDATKSWGIFGVEEPAAAWADGLTTLQKRDCVKGGGKSKRVVTVNKKLAPRLGLPAGTVEIIATKPADKDGTPASRELVLIAPDRSTGTERTWIVLASDEATAVARLKGVLAGPSALGSRPGLASLRDPASAGAFVTAGGLAWLFAKDKTDVQMVSAARTLLRARDLPTGGRTPIVMRMASTHDAKGKGGETSVRVSVDAAVLGDVAALLF